MFYEKEFRKKKKIKEFRIEKVIKRTDNMLHVKWKGLTIPLIVGFIKKMLLYEMSHFTKPNTN